jgi:hypothetical protein
MVTVRLTIGVIVLATNLRCMAQINASEVTRVPAISATEVQRAFQDIYATPPTLPLTGKSPEAHRGNVWLRSTDEGLHIWGKVERGEQEIQWPRQRSEMLSSDHVEVWLAASTDPAMPTVGWGNQFGMSELKSAQDCAGEGDPHTGDTVSELKNCQRWYNEQLQYRQQLRRLFARQWLIATETNYRTHSFEEFASSAYATLEASLFPEDLPTLLKPKSDDPLKVEIGIDATPETRKNGAGREYVYNRPTGYHFHVLIPYSEFPPAQQLKLSDLYVAVDVFSPAPEGQKQGTYSTTAPNRRWGQPATFNHIRLEAPRTYALSPCEFEPKQQDLYDTDYAAWFLPTGAQEPNLSSTFALINPEAGYLYEPGPVSPQVQSAKYFWKTLEDGATVCGPTLSWSKGRQIYRTDGTIDEEHFASKTLADGWTLLESGPLMSTRSRFGSGECGACGVMDFAIYAVSPQGDITGALGLNQDLSGRPRQPSGADITISPDWSRVTLYLNGPEEDQNNSTSWSSITYCRQGHEYKPCDEGENVKPPNPPHFKELRGP